MAILQSINPYTLEVNAQIPTISSAEVTQAIITAHQAFLSWKETDVTYKKELFLRLADLLEAEISECALLETKEMGMLYHVSQAGLQKTVGLIRYFANHFDEILAPRNYETEGLTVEERYDPLGVIFGVAPWNFPFNQLLRAAVPNILAGNVQLYKHASNVPLVAQKIQELFERSGFPKGVYTNLFVPSSMSEEIIAHPLVRGVNLTGSETAGSAVGALAGKYLKPSVLELGGNDAFFVLEDADMEQVIRLAVQGRMRNGGQACNASKRFLVPKSLYENFINRYQTALEALILGDPMDAQTQLQPLSSEKALLDVDAQVQKAIASGARCITGGKRADMKGYFYEPTLLADVTMEVSSFFEEIFGPVASLISYSTIEEGILLANATDFGLSAVVVGQDEKMMRDVAQKLDGGMIFLNMNAGSKASLPFGGIKKSGYGKENGPDGLKAFTNKKVIVKEKS